MKFLVVALKNLDVRLNVELDFDWLVNTLLHLGFVALNVEACSFVALVQLTKVDLHQKIIGEYEALSVQIDLIVLKTAAFSTALSASDSSADNEVVPVVYSEWFEDEEECVEKSQEEPGNYVLLAQPLSVEVLRVITKPLNRFRSEHVRVTEHHACENIVNDDG